MKSEAIGCLVEVVRAAVILAIAAFATDPFVDGPAHYAWSLIISLVVMTLVDIRVAITELGGRNNGN